MAFLGSLDDCIGNPVSKFNAQRAWNGLIPVPGVSLDDAHMRPNCRTGTKGVGAQMC